MAYRCELTRWALLDADEAYEWIAQVAPGRAARWYQGLLRAIETLTDNPRRCSLAPEAEDIGQEIRQLLYGRRSGVYRILFVIRDDSIVRVLAIRHGARRPLSSTALQGRTEDD
jgi:plasmid stabilization system protein ParE